MELVIRATAIYWFLWLVVRGSGRRSLAELTPLDLLLIVVLGDFVQQGVTQEDMSVTGAVIAVSVFVAWTLAADALGRRSQKANRIIAGEPIILILRGQVFDDHVSRAGMSQDELKEAARIEGIGDLAQVEFCVLESDGKLSFVRP